MTIFIKKEKKPLICGIVGGYPDINTSKEIVKTIIDSGADIIEIGIPFSDPMADGPTIQNASLKALANGVTPLNCFDIVKDIKKNLQKYPNSFHDLF